MRSATTTATIDSLRTIFARFGLPDQIVSDNGPQFTSTEYMSFMKQNGIRAIHSAPYHPATNGLAERFVQSFKLAMKSAKATESTINKCLDQFLLAYRNAPHSTTHASPASMMFGRPLATRLDLVKPTSDRRVFDNQQTQVEYRAQRCRDIDFEPGNDVLVRDYRPNGPKWQPATIDSRTGPVSYTVEVPGVGPSGSTWRRHTDQMIPTVKPTSDDAPNMLVPPATMCDDTGTHETGHTVAQESNNIPAKPPDLKAPTPMSVPSNRLYTPVRTSARNKIKTERLIEHI